MMIKGDENMGKKKKFCSNGTGIPVAANYHFFDLQQVVEWTTICLDGDKIKEKVKKENKWKEKEEEKGKLVILIK